MMFGGKQRQYDSNVAALFPKLGFSVEDAGVMKTGNVLDIAWNQKYSEHEGALYVAYLVYAGMLKAGEPRAADVIAKITHIQNTWLSDGLIRGSLVARFTSKAEEWREAFSAH